jgi:hypothetical protein
MLIFTKVKDKLMFGAPLQALLAGYIQFCVSANPSLLLTGKFKGVQAQTYLMLILVITLPIGIMVFISTRKNGRFEDKVFSQTWGNLY